MQNKPNFPRAMMNLTPVETMTYEQVATNNANKNKPTQTQPVAAKSCTKPDQTQFTAPRRSLGTAVFGGMLAATIIGVFLIPVLYVVIQTFSEKVRGVQKVSR
jgi:hypothetical protein